MTFVLDTTSRKIILDPTTGGGDLQFTASWADATATSLVEGASHGVGDAVNEVDVVAAPAASTRRIVKSITIHNANGSNLSREFILVYEDGASERIIARGTLAAGATWYSDNGGAYAPLLSLSPQADHAVLIGPLSGGPTAPTWRGLALSDLPAIATNRLLGRVSPSSPGDVEEITPGAGVLTWLQTPTSGNLFSALTTKAGIGGDVVFSQAPSFQGLTSTTGMTLVGTLSAGGTLPTATAQIVFTGVSTGPFSCLEIRNATTGAVPVITVNSASTNYGLEIASKGVSTLTLKGDTVSVSNNTATAGGTIEARGGTGSGGGGSVRLYERSTNGTNYWSWLAPDSLSVSVVQELPDGYGNPGDVLRTDGFGIMSWAPIREVLTANRTYYVRTDGSNSNNGLTNSSAGAWLTIQHAYDVIRSTLDTGGFTVTIAVNSGTYTAGLSIGNAWVGGGQLQLVGDIITPANVKITSASGACINVLVPLPGILTVSGFELSTTTTPAACFNYQAPGSRIEFQAINFGACTGSHIQANDGGTIFFIGNYAIVGDAAVAHYRAGRKGIIGHMNPITVNISGSRTFTHFVLAATQSYIRIVKSAVTYSISGSVTAIKYTSLIQSFIDTVSAPTDVNYFPGTPGSGTADAATFALYGSL